MHISVAASLGIAHVGAKLLSTPASCIRYSSRTPPRHTLQRVLKSSHARALTTQHRETSQSPTSRWQLKLWKHRGQREVHTLVPTKLTSRDYVDFSLKSQPFVKFINQSNTPGPDDTSNLPVRTGGFQLHAHAFQDARFPPNAAGFLYYHHPPFCPPLMGEVRLRVTSSSDPASFAAGSDLLTPLGLPWKIPLLYMALGKRYATLRTLLLHDDLVTPQHLETAAAVAETLRGTGRRRQNYVGTCRTSIIGSLRQAFIVRFGILNGALLIVGKDTVLRKHFREIGLIRVPVHSANRAERYSRYYPFRGTQSSLASLVQDGADSFVFRFSNLLL